MTYPIHRIADTEPDITGYSYVQFRQSEIKKATYRPLPVN